MLTGLRADRAVVLWGGSGEGKTTVAREAACRMQETGNLVLSVALDMRSALSPPALCYRALAEQTVATGLLTF